MTDHGHRDPETAPNDIPTDRDYNVYYMALRLAKMPKRPPMGGKNGKR